MKRMNQVLIKKVVPLIFLKKALLCRISLNLRMTIIKVNLKLKVHQEGILISKMKIKKNKVFHQKILK